MEFIFGIMFILISATDIGYRVIPKRITFLGYFLLFLSSIISVFMSFIFYLFYVLIAKIFQMVKSKSGIGYGDIRVSGLVFGFNQNLESGLKIHLLAWLISGFFSISLNAIRGGWKSLPFAPFLTLAVYLS